MPNRVIVISKNDPVGKRPVVNPRKLPLHEFDRWGVGNFQIYETGYVPLGMRWNYDGLCNTFWRFYYNSRPGSYIEIGKQRHYLNPNTIMVIPENTFFNSRGAREVPHLWIHFSPPLFARFIASRFVLPLDAALASLVANLQNGMLGGRETRPERQRIFHACLAVIHCCFSRVHLKQEPELPPSLLLILEGIERSLAFPPSNQELSRQANMSLEGFSRWFKGHLGISPARYVLRRRIRDSCRLLSLTDQPIDAIAEAVGFTNRHHFSRVFSQVMECGPAHFRRREPDQSRRSDHQIST